MRRWCDHIQPDQLTKTRYFGGWCGRKRTRYQTRCRELLGQSQEPRCNPADEHAESASSDDLALRCLGCEYGSLRLVGSTAKPSWTMLLTHFDTRCASWYADREYKAFCEHLEDEYGIGYEDWCLEMRIESPMRNRRTAGLNHRHNLTNCIFRDLLPGLASR